MDKRLLELREWSARMLGVSEVAAEPASADASFRRYFRVFAGRHSYIVMDAPPQREPLEPFVRIARRMRSIGLNVPEVLAIDAGLGFALLGDLGSTTYLQVLCEERADALYEDAFRSLRRLQRHGLSDPGFLPPYDESLLHSEMELFRQWYLRRHLRLEIGAGLDTMLDRLFGHLAAAALEQPAVWVHRDYHSRNLMATERDNPGIVDFQDAVHGPVTYDLVSLLRDCYISWPPERVEAWALEYRRQAAADGLPVARDEATFLRWFDLMGVQRHLKAIGIFARLNHRDGKPDYLEDIPRVVDYVRQVAARYPALAGLASLANELPGSGEHACTP